MRAHQIVDGKVVNTIEIAALDAVAGLVCIDASLGGKIGDLWDGLVFSTPPPTAAELEAIRLAFNATVHAAIAAIELKQHRATREHILAPNAVDPVTTRTPAQQIGFLNAQIVALRATLRP